MFGQGYHNQMLSHRTSDLQLSAFVDIPIQNSEAYFTQACSLLHACDNCGVKKQTKYIAKKSLDRHILRNPQSTQDQIWFYSVSFFRLAVKFNQDPSVYDQFGFDECVDLCENKFTKEQFKQFEELVWNKEEHKMSFSTPYDFFGTYQTAFGMSITQKQRMNIIMMIDYSLSIPELIFLNAQTLFFACLLKVHRCLRINSFYAMRQTKYEIQVEQASEIIKNYYQQEIGA